MIDKNYKFAIQAMQLLREKKFSEAISICEAGLVGYPSYPCAIAILSAAYYFNNEADTAKIIIDAAYGSYSVNAAVTNTKNKIYSNSLDLASYQRLSSSSVENTLQEEIIISTTDDYDNIYTTSNNSDYYNEQEENENSEEEDETVIEKLENNSTSNNIEINTEGELIVSTDEETKFEFPYEYASAASASTTPIAKLYQRDLDFSRMELDLDTSMPIIIEKFHLGLLLEIPDIKPFENIFGDRDKINLASAREQKESNQNAIININLESSVDAGASTSTSTNNILDDKVLEFLELSKKLEAAKIAPVVEFEDTKDNDDAPIVASETMARLFVKQKLYKKAIEVYNLLLEEKPEKFEYYQEQINNLLEK